MSLPSVPNSTFPTFRSNLNNSLAEGQNVSNFSENETPSGTINGVYSPVSGNTVFTLLNTPVASPGGSGKSSLRLFKNGLRMQEGLASPVTGDYSISGDTITFTWPPLVGDILVADYRF